MAQSGLSNDTNNFDFQRKGKNPKNRHFEPLGYLMTGRWQEVHVQNLVDKSALAGHWQVIDRMGTDQINEPGLDRSLAGHWQVIGRSLTGWGLTRSMSQGSTASVAVEAVRTTARPLVCTSAITAAARVTYRGMETETGLPWCPKTGTRRQ